ncbi:hypothetical protein RB195_017058 [Necator americanus]|uniref:Uncharacterized protein n=1 Tax=Necator americanus TaxID=51031 RepID=A0ABR1C3F2_NECAM
MKTTLHPRHAVANIEGQLGKGPPPTLPSTVASVASSATFSFDGLSPHMGHPRAGLGKNTVAGAVAPAAVRLTSKVCRRQHCELAVAIREERPGRAAGHTFSKRPHVASAAHRHLEAPGWETGER